MRGAGLRRATSGRARPSQVGPNLEHAAPHPTLPHSNPLAQREARCPWPIRRAGSGHSDGCVATQTGRIWPREPCACCARSAALVCGGARSAAHTSASPTETLDHLLHASIRPFLEQTKIRWRGTTGKSGPTILRAAAHPTHLREQRRKELTSLLISLLTSLLSHVLALTRHTFENSAARNSVSKELSFFAPIDIQVESESRRNCGSEIS